MHWLEITVETTALGMEPLEQALTLAGFSDLVLEDGEALSGFLEENRSYWDYIDEKLEQKLEKLSQIKLYLEGTDTAGLKKLEQLLQSLRQKNAALGSLKLTVSPLPDTNWEESWKDNYPAQPVGQRLLVLPYWEDAEHTDGRIPVILDPGLTFGTGAHPSTQMVMEQMEKLVKPGSACLDLGSGSGILSITALRLGAKTATGVDIDPKAEDIARENAAYNGFGSDVFSACTGNVTADKALMRALQEKAYDLVLVNIVADVIISLAPVLPSFLQEKSVLIASGILDKRLADVTAALQRAGLQILQVVQKEEWRCITAKRSTV